MSDPREVLALAAQDLAAYAAAVYPLFELPAHIRLVVEKLEAIERGDIRRLMVFLPPRHGKSLLATQLFPAWYLGRHPDRSIITVTYAQELSDDFGRRVRNLVSDPLHRAIFPECVLAEDSASMRRFSTSRGGSYYAVGRGGAITGRGCSLLVLDDCIKDAEEARSDAIRRGLYQWYSHVARTRLEPGGSIVVIETRWHMADLAGWLLAEHADERWEVVSLPAIAESDESFRKAGEALWPERFTLEVLEQIHSAVGGAAWASLYQQRPAAAAGAIFRREWWQFYQPPLAVPITRTVQSWDTAFKASAENDYSVCTTWGVAETGYYLLHFWRDRVEFPRLKQMLAAFAGEWKPNAILVEDRASGQSLIQELKSATPLPVLAVKADSDKVARAQAVTPLVEAGRAFLPESPPWLGDFMDELAAFPNGVHDDIVDSTTQALNYLREQSISPPLFISSSANSAEFDKEALWEKAMLGIPLTEKEIDRL